MAETDTVVARLRYRAAARATPKFPQETFLEWQAASELAREAAEAKAARLEEALTWRATHRHVKRGTEYMLDSYGEIQTDTPLGDYAKVAIYKARDGKTWVRSLSEFEDGRFAALEAK